MAAISNVLAGLFGMIGIIIGTMVSAAAEEELKGYRSLFRILRDFAFLLTAGFVLFEAGIIILVLGLFLLTVVLKQFSAQDTSNTIALLMAMLLILTAGTSLFALTASMFMVIGALEGGWWSANHEQVISKGVLRARAWMVMFKDHVLFWALPLAAVLFVI